MKTIKLLISCVIITIIGMLTLNGVKAATPTFSVESKEVTAGGEVEVKVNLSEDVTLITGNLELSFDKNKLEVKKIVQGAPIEDFKGSMDVTNVANANRNGYIRIVPAASSDKKLAKGTLLTITFKAKDGVTGSQALNFTVRELKADSEDGTSTKDIRNTVTSTNGKIDVKVASTPTPSPKPTVTASPNPTGTVTPNPTGTETPNPTGTATPNPTGTETPDPTGTATPKPTDTDKPNSTGTQTPNPTSTATPKPEETKKVPKTGDISVVMFIVIAVISLVGCIILIKKMN